MPRNFHFSERWRERELEPNALTQALSVRRSAGREIFDLTLTNPTQCELETAEPWPNFPDDAALRRYDPDPRGLLQAREAIAYYYADRGEIVDPNEIFLTAGTSEGYAFLFKLLCAPGDAVLIPQPSYPLLQALAELENLRLQSYRWVAAPTVAGSPVSWRLDRESLTSLSMTKTRAICVIQPHNPTGSLIHPDDAELLLAFAAERGLALIVDEVFADFVHAPSVTTRLLRTSETVIFTLNGLSKTLGLPQLKLAWIHVDGEPAAKAQALSHLEWICDAYLSVGAVPQILTPPLLARCAAWQTPLRNRLRLNLECLRNLPVTAAFMVPQWPQGGWCLPVHCPGVQDDEDFAVSLLRDHGVLVHPGYFYDFETENFLVLSLLPPPHIFESGLQRLWQHLEARADG